MKLDTVLTRDESGEVLREVMDLATHRSIWARGISQSGRTGFQFVAEVDVANQRWHSVSDSGDVSYGHDGTVTFINGGPQPTTEGPASMEFPRGMSTHLKMLHPESFLMWGRPRESFYPMLAQRLGKRSILLTFEHVEDPPSRATMVVDLVTGVVRSFQKWGTTVILSDPVVDQPFTARTDYVFEPLTEWIRPTY